ncbi:REST corepressor-like [Drosophila guanche]|uniref:Blast:REST corepressor n=1 Tax=Drosophila guanche TaxID=7266 RepID=A0A3B0KKK9_DROGU|nr:REST corepressor-like [Drosophila guanche]SPP86326.1 blast:REST corepressor [Drosophila guanche]
MVLAERNITDVVQNGRRSHEPCPNTNIAGGVASNANVVASGGAGAGVVNPTNPQSNEKASTIVPGAGTPESSTKRNGKSKARQSEYDKKIRVGSDYQAVYPPLFADVERRPEQMNERALLVWSPTKEIPDLKFEEYISVAKEKYGYNGEQALALLFWHKHDLDRSGMDLANFMPFLDEWTIKDKVLFEQAFQFQGKSFHRIRQMLPDKSIASLVKYYYSWKKTRHRSSAMDRQEKIMKTCVKDGSKNGSEVGSNEESDNDDKTGPNKNGTNNSSNSACSNNNCDNNNGGSINSNSNGNSNDLNVDQLCNCGALATCKDISVYLAERDRKISALMVEIQKNRQLMEVLDKECDAINVDDIVSKPAIAISESSTTQPPTSARWTPDEIKVRDNGKNYPMIAKLVPTKTKAHLDQIVKEYEAGMSEESGVEDHNEQIDDGSAPAANSDSVIKLFTDASNNGLNPDQELQAKKAKPELVTAEVQSDNSDAAVVTAIAIPAEVVNSNSSLVVEPTGNKTASITIMDESDTATNSSADMAISSTNTGVSASSSSLSSANTPPAPILVDQKEPDSAEISALNHSSKGDADGAGANAATGNANAKRKISTVTSAEQPPPKKVALCTSVELLEK